MAVTAITSILAASANAWRPESVAGRADWCCANIRLPLETSAQPGHFDLHDHAYLRGILDTVDDPSIRRIVFIAGTQLGKTECLRAIVLSQGEVGRAPLMLAGPDQAYTREQRRLIYRMAEISPAISCRIPHERNRNDQWIDLERCLVYLAWSGSTQRLSGRSCKVVLCSEVDRWQHSVSLAEERTKAFPDNSLVFFEGTPVGSSPYLDAAYKSSDRRTFRVPCPVCGHYQALRFFPHRGGPHQGCGGVAGLKDASDNWLSPAEAKRNAYYVCERGCRIEQREKNDMVRRGVWCPAGCEVVDGVVTGTPSNAGNTAGFHLSSLYSATVSIGQAAVRYLELRDEPGGTERFWNDWLGMAYIDRGKTPRWKDLGARLSGTHPRGVVPRGAYFVTVGCDVQLRGVYWIARAWGDQKTSWLVDWGFLPKLAAMDSPDGEPTVQLASDLAQLDEAIVGRRLDVDGENPLGYSSLMARLCGIDRGYRAHDTDAFVRAHPGGRVVAVAGDPHIVPGTLFRPMRTDRSARTGRINADAVECWGIDTNAYKTEIAERWQADRRFAGCWWLPGNVLEVDGGEDYLRQLTAETRHYEAVHGRKTTAWRLISNSLPNHYWDCEVYATALADMVVGREWDASKWRWAVRKKTKQADSVSHGFTPRIENDSDFSAR